jgi:malate dehydrogenase (quinone)
LDLLPSFYSDPKSDPEILKGMRERSDGLLGLSG